jgi:O-antigen ligase
MCRESPVFGVGVGNFEEEFKHVAHNSHVQAFVEIGVFGVGFFLGAFVFSLWTLWNLRKDLKEMGGRHRSNGPPTGSSSICQSSAVPFSIS